MSRISTIAVLGAGTMGHGIAQVAAMAGYKTRLFDTDLKAIDEGMSQIRANLVKGVERGKVSEETQADALAHLITVTELVGALRGADLVIEAVPERMELKLDLVRRTFEEADEDVIFATNTSSLSVTAIAAAARRPGQVVGMHFFNPPHIMRLLEVVRAEQTSDDTLETVREVGRAMDRDLIVVSDSAGFATSRLGLILGLEAMRMVESGVATAEEIDKAMELGYRHPMGPLKLTDMVGLDVRLAIAEYLFAEVGEQFRPPQILRRMVRAGRLGKKSGRGFYTWD